LHWLFHFSSFFPICLALREESSLISSGNFSTDNSQPENMTQAPFPCMPAGWVSARRLDMGLRHKLSYGLELAPIQCISLGISPCVSCSMLRTPLPPDSPNITTASSAALTPHSQFSEPHPHPQCAQCCGSCDGISQCFLYKARDVWISTSPSSCLGMWFFPDFLTLGFAVSLETPTAPTSTGQHKCYFCISSCELINIWVIHLHMSSFNSLRNTSVGGTGRDTEIEMKDVGPLEINN
jgi:hypothetical protein